MNGEHYFGFFCISIGGLFFSGVGIYLIRLYNDFCRGKVKGPADSEVFQTISRLPFDDLGEYQKKPGRPDLVLVLGVFLLICGIVALLNLACVIGHFIFRE